MKTILSYLLWPNPGVIGYTSTSIRLFLALAVGLILLAFALRFWRKKIQNPVTKKLSRTWATASAWFGIVLAVLTVSRAEGISYVSIRLWFFVWGAALIFYVLLQAKLFTSRHYEVLPKEKVNDPRDKYLPKKK